MTRLSIRRERLLRLRSIEHRIATLRVANADAAVANLAQIASRLEKLRNETSVHVGETTGTDLMSIAEIAMRLEHAQHGLQAPIDEAHSRRSEFEAMRVAAQMRQEGAAKLHTKAASEEVVSYERRTDANRQHRKREPNFGDVK